MRRVIILAILATFVSVTNPARAANVNLVHAAPVPCSVACSYWDAPEVALGTAPCVNDFPPLAFTDSTLRFTSTTSTAAIEIVAQSEMDYDTWICSDTTPSILVLALVNYLDGDCDSWLLGPTPVATVGCTESGTLTYTGLVAQVGFAPPGDRFRVLSYNWLDHNTNRVALDGPVACVSNRTGAICS